MGPRGLNNHEIKALLLFFNENAEKIRGEMHINLICAIDDSIRRVHQSMKLCTTVYLLIKMQTRFTL